MKQLSKIFQRLIGNQNNLNNYSKSLEFDYLKTFAGYGNAYYNIQNGEINKKSYSYSNVFSYLLFDINHTPNPCCRETSRISNSDIKCQEILNSLSFKPNEEILMPCRKIYRDAIVFYSKNSEIVGVLQICFMCNEIINEDFRPLKTDVRTFFELGKLLKNLRTNYEESLKLKTKS